MAIEKRQHIVDKYKLVSTKIEELSHGSFILVGGGLFDLYCDRLIRNNKNSSIYKFRRIETTEYPKFILSYFVHEMSMNKYPELYFMYKNANDIIEAERAYFSTDDWNFSARISVHMGLCFFFFDIDINTSLLFNKEIRTDDDILNSDIEVVESSLGLCVINPNIIPYLRPSLVSL